MIDERTEQLINRKLDGELRESEALELNRALIRSPEAQALLAEYERTDHLAASALEAVLADGAAPIHRPAEIEAWTSRGRAWWTRCRRGLGLAVAAAIAALVAGFPGTRVTPLGPQRDWPPSASTVEAGVLPPSPIAGQPVIEGPRRLNEQIHRDVIAVYDEETQSVYLLEIDQIRSKTEPVWKNY